MLLSLLGLTTTRQKALGLFKLKRSNPDYPGASHVDIGNVFARTARVERWWWEYYSQFDFASVSQSLVTQLRIRRHPTLLSFGATHKNGDLQCTHVAVVIDATEKKIELLDPLGSAPRVSSNANVWLRAADWPQPVSVIGSSYSINHESEAAVLRWTSKESLCLDPE
ncbi:MAG: hypothetical protein ACREA9_19060 [Pyrinomonadaceae bacterium]